MPTLWPDAPPLIAILRGIRPEAAGAVGKVLFDAGFRLLEVPLNSPQPLRSIRILADMLGDGCLIGAGTVMTPAQVANVAAEGGRLIVMPHADSAVIEAAKQIGMVCTPGVATPTEALGALAAGADGLKIFPADQVGPAGLKAWRATLPPDTSLLPVGGITPDTMAPWFHAGASGFGIGSALYTPGIDTDEVARRARAFVQAWNRLSRPSDSPEEHA